MLSKDGLADIAKDICSFCRISKPKLWKNKLRSLYYHGSPFIRCEAGPLWAKIKQEKKARKVK